MKNIDDIRHANLQLLSKEHGGPTALAEALGKNPSQVSQWLNRSINSATGKPRAVGTASARFIERALGKPEGWMDTPHAGDGGNTAPGPDIRGQVPVISFVQAGDYENVVDNYHPGDGFEFVTVTSPIRRHTFALKVKNDSMLNPHGTPSFPPGIIVVIEPDLEAQIGDFVVVKNGSDEATFKQLVQDDGELYLKPLNPAYRTKPFPKDGHIVGVLREAIWKFR